MKCSYCGGAGGTEQNLEHNGQCPRFDQRLVLMAHQMFADDGRLLDEAVAHVGHTEAGERLRRTWDVPRADAENAVLHALALRGLVTRLRDPGVEGTQ